MKVIDGSGKHSLQDTATANTGSTDMPGPDTVYVVGTDWACLIRWREFRLIMSFGVSRA